MALLSEKTWGCLLINLSFNSDITSVKLNKPSSSAISAWKTTWNSKSPNSDLSALKSELGDLLFQVVFHAEMADEEGLFNLTDVISELNDKLIRRHPHVFSDKSAITA